MKIDRQSARQSALGKTRRACLLTLLLCPALPALSQVGSFDLEPVGDPMVIASPVDGGSDQFTHNSGMTMSPDGDVAVGTATAINNRTEYWYTLVSPDGTLQRLQLGQTQQAGLSSPGVSLADDDFAVLTLPTGNGNDLRSVGVAHQRGAMFPTPLGGDVLQFTTESERLGLPSENCEAIDLNVPERLPNRIDAQTGRSTGTLPLAVECADTRVVSARLRAGGGSGEVDLRRLDATTPERPPFVAKQAHQLGAKAFQTPPATVSSGIAMGTRADGAATLLYAGRGEVFPANFAIVVEYDPSGGVDRIRELMEVEVAAEASQAMSVCGHLEQDQYWLSFADEDNRVAIARINGDTEELRFPGTTLGPVDVACDPWGNAVAAWWGETNNGTAVFVAAINQFGQLANVRNIPLPDESQSLRLNAALNADGQVAIAWTDSSGQLTLQRFRLSGNATIDGSFIGSYFNAFFNGEGFIFDVALVVGVHSVVVYYFTYDADGSGRQAWVVGSGPIDQNRFTAEVAIGEGASFGDDFNAQDVTLTLWGTVHAQFLGCGLVRIEMVSDLFPNFGYLAQPLTGTPEGGSGRCIDGVEAPFEGTPLTSIDATLAGSWFDPSRNGEGLVYDIVETPDGPLLVLYYFTYAADGSGRQAWLVGAAPIIDNQASVQVAYGEGAQFGPDFNPADVSLIPWGTIVVTFNSCVQAFVEYSGLWGNGGYFILPLTAPPLGFEGSCTP